MLRLRFFFFITSTTLAQNFFLEWFLVMGEINEFDKKDDSSTLHPNLKKDCISAGFKTKIINEKEFCSDRQVYRERYQIDNFILKLNKLGFG